MRSTVTLRVLITRRRVVSGWLCSIPEGNTGAEPPRTYMYLSTARLDIAPLLAQTWILNDFDLHVASGLHAY